MVSNLGEEIFVIYWYCFVYCCWFVGGYFFKYGSQDYVVYWRFFYLRVWYGGWR